MNEGAGGFFKGAWQGFSGLIIKPVAGRILGGN